LRSRRRLAAFFFGGFFDVILGARATVEALRRGILDNQIDLKKKNRDRQKGGYIYIPLQNEVAMTNLLFEIKHTTMVVVLYQCRIVK
jgi:hypothetical protein